MVVIMFIPPTTTGKKLAMSKYYSPLFVMVLSLISIKYLRANLQVEVVEVVQAVEVAPHHLRGGVLRRPRAVPVPVGVLHQGGVKQAHHGLKLPKRARARVRRVIG